MPTNCPFTFLAGVTGQDTTCRRVPSPLQYATCRRTPSLLLCSMHPAEECLSLHCRTQHAEECLPCLRSMQRIYCMQKNTFLPLCSSLSLAKRRQQRRVLNSPAGAHAEWVFNRHPSLPISLNWFPVRCCSYRACWKRTQVRGRVHTKVFSGSSKRQQGEVCMTVSAPPVEQKPTRHFLPIGDSSPSDDCLSRDLSEPTERRHQSFLKPRILFPGFLCPLQDVCASLQEDNGVQIESKFPKGDYTCCDLVVKIKECKKSEDPTTPEPSPAAPSPAPRDGAGSPGLSEDCSESQQTPARSLTLQEALEVRKPQFISRSQERLKKLEHMVQQRKAQRKEDLRQKQSLLPIRTSKKQFTIPHPLSDNLFKPKERCISEKEMHMRSKRIYDNLPEVKKKKEEQRKRVILQSNRLRAEVFKKQLLDQLLQRNAV
ncbi:(E2-independent) E3 ubiquitin-conjugating enzyme FATS isoform X5 [Homo sapiens]|uniref:(E2-independent) E3 ubiquitin-conjugating enzyme FATS isoform X5 n=1 Tax=Homo sapiens TaxID=9606 RepID=UPI0005CFFF19|nr:(E2-independent) E3 ubiquitin-conjugating enzyme FATS isoform X5 [Homo sapiens]XP_054220677.1 (E2-independent) E3 ubiquitin-conjugating enzyme FATS isoform X5 [Homo sapiens]